MPVNHQQNMFLGVHCSVSGGLHNAFDEANRLQIDTFQIFSRNQRQWDPKPLSKQEIDDFENAFKKSGVKIMFSHVSYLVNLASADERLWNHSVEMMVGEVERCHRLGLAFTVVHPGALKGQPEEQGIGRIASALKIIFNKTSHSNVKILLENTAGQGTSVGWKFEQLRKMIDRTESDRTGVCFDTCHAFAAGYDIRTKPGFEETISQFDKIIGLKHLNALHLNDSRGELGSHLDRHEHIGKGKLGVEPFRWVMNSFIHLPKALETPKEDDWDERNLKLLRGLVA